ncbi:MAG TPA: 5-(carboxyamino)imidazole ribonucleotide synthase [Flavipsychrobacter sp.]|nr:5-(carboxyamino)imidazole ribonucleotide synthase [Flavipsychrobacter sp.]
MIQTRLGILGGGQLGAMLIQSGISFGVPISVLESDPHAPCSLYASTFVVGDPLNYDDVMRFGASVDIITIEKEAVNVDALMALRDMGKKVFPSPEIIGMVQDKWKQKQFLLENNIPVVHGILINDPGELEEKLSNYPACLKLCRDGYDGRGVMMLRSEEDLADAFDAPSVLENYVAIKEEIAVIVARNENGEIRLYEAVSMVFNKEKYILDYQLCPARINDDISRQASNLAIAVAKSMDLVGIVAVEMFVTENDEVIVNELAPRPHNSGHHSIEACVTSQYEQLLRAIFGLPLGDTSTNAPSVMVNIIGKADIGSNLKRSVTSLLTMKDVYVHWYGKKERLGRKLGHVTIKDRLIENAVATGETVRNILNS